MPSGQSPIDRSAAELSAAKQALLARRLKGKALDGGGRRPIPRRSVPGDPAPLSYPQMRVWREHSQASQASTFNVPMGRRIRGHLDTELLHRAFTEVVHRHEILRTGYRLESGQPVQVVFPKQSLPFLCHDLRSGSGPDPESAWREAAATIAATPFDLASGEVFRVHLWRVAEDEHILLVCEHHIAADAWSTSILFHEIAALYSAFREGAPSPLPPLPLQYADFAVWHRRELETPELRAQVDYWRRQLEGAPAIVTLPLDRPRPTTRTFRGAYTDFALPNQTREALRRTAHEHGATLFMVLLAAFKTVLFRWTGQEDLVVGTPVAGRPRRELESLIGFFLNTLVLRTRLDGDPSFVGLLGQVRETALGAYANQDVPFDLLVDTLQPRAVPGAAPLFQVVFALQNAPIEPLQLPGAEVSLLDIEFKASKHDLTFGMWERDDILQGWLEYNTDLFDPASIRGLIADWELVATALARHPGIRISQLPPRGSVGVR
jgi:hypothetical protein